MKEITEHLYTLQDRKYKKFQSNLIPNIDQETVIGIRMPILRKYAKELKGTELEKEFLKELPHHYYDENQLHALLISNKKDYDECIKYVEEFLPYIDNWATCDVLRPKVFKKNLEDLEKHIDIWLKSSKEYTLRYAVGMLESYYLDDAFDEKHLEAVSLIHDDRYYVMMMNAWYFASALVKQPVATLPYIEQGKLDKITNNKAIQKARESFRVSDDLKEYLKTLKRTC